MTKIPLDHFLNKEIERVYMAGAVSEANEVETLLSEAGIDYAVEMEEFTSLFLMDTPHVGAAFYVHSGQSRICRDLLRKSGMVQGILED